jgi:uncharacterized protein
MADPISVARAGARSCVLLPALANRHGLVTGATGTGKTVTLQTLAHAFSARGVPVFLADVKGDLAGISQPGHPSDKLRSVLTERGLAVPAPEACPTRFWDVFGEQGHPVRATVSDLGPLLLARMMSLNETQAGVLQIAFEVADDRGWLLLDTKDLRAMLQHVSEGRKEYAARYGNVAPASVAAIQRALLQIESQGGDRFFGEPMLAIDDLLATEGGRGVVNVLAADRLLSAPKVYATFLLWLLSELFETLPEVGDREKPKMFFFFDEAHLLFEDAPTALVQRIELVVRLIRSKGVGVYFVSQNPQDLPESVLGQLGNRVQHALRAFTPRDLKAVKAAAQTMRPNAALDLVAAIGELAVGEALVSLLDAEGRPSVTERAFVLPPGSQIGPITAEQRATVVARSPVRDKYGAAVDRESAYEQLTARVAEKEAPAAAGGVWESLSETLFGSTGPRGGRREGLAEAAAKTAARSIGSSVGRELVRGILGSLLGRR